MPEPANWIAGPLLAVIVPELKMVTPEGPSIRMPDAPMMVPVLTMPPRKAETQPQISMPVLLAVMVPALVIPPERG